MAILERLESDNEVVLVRRPIVLAQALQDQLPVRYLRGLLAGSGCCSGEGALDGLDGRLRYPGEGVLLRFSAPTIILPTACHSTLFLLDLTQPFIDLACFS